MLESPHQTQDLEQTKQQIRDLVSELAQLARSDIPPHQFYPEFLHRVVAALAASGGAVWTQDQTGNLKLEYQINFQQTGLDGDASLQRSHSQLLAQVLSSGRGILVPPRSGPGSLEESATSAANPTEHLLIVEPLFIDKQPVGAVEVLQRPNPKAAAQRGYQRFLSQMCALASDYLKNRQLRQMADRQHLWAQLESFIHELHSSLRLRQVAYTVVNDGRRLIGCDRVSLALRFGRRTLMESISGQDLVDRRANLVRLMTRLADTVIHTGEPLHYQGQTSDLPPSLEQALADYVDESGSKTIIIEPLRPPSATGEPSPCFGALIVERIEDSRPAPAMVDRLALVARHSATAVNNALEQHRMVLVPLWRSLGRTTEKLRGRRLVITSIVLGTLATLVGALFIVPWHFRPQAKGELLPLHRAEVFAAIDGEIDRVHVRHGDSVRQGDVLVELRNPRLEIERQQLVAQLQQVQATFEGLRNTRDHRITDPRERTRLTMELLRYQAEATSLQKQIQLIEQQLEGRRVPAPHDGIVTTWDVQKRLPPGRPVQRGQSLLSIADPEGAWVLEVKMPEHRMGHILRAVVQRADQNPVPLDDLPAEARLPVEFILASQPEHSYRGSVTRIAKRADLTETDGNIVRLTIEPDPAELPRLQPGKGFAVAGAEVRAKVDCGTRSLGYVLFVDVIEFVQSRILF